MDSRSSFSEIDKAACIIKEPLSTSVSTKCTEQPVILESFLIASLIALLPLKREVKMDEYLLFYS